MKIIKLALLLTLISYFQASAKIYAQKINLDAHNIPLSEAMEQVKNQTGYRYFLKGKHIAYTKVSAKLKNADLQTAMKALLKEQPLTWVLEDETIVIHPALVKRTLSGQISQQPRQLTGRVSDEDGSPLEGVTVAVKGSTTGTTTDASGQYRLSIQDASDVVAFSMIGFQPVEHTVGNQNTINVTLKSELSALEEVVVVGYGTQKKVNLTGAVSSVSGEDIAVRPAGQTTAALQGLAPGVTITQRSGKPGSDGGDIRIRGVGTIGNAGPMILIDGVEGSINNIDPNLIESVSILKDAASASIYGSRAANGVILVTTKRGVANRTAITYNNYLGWQDPTNMPELVNALDHILLTNEAYTNVGASPLYPEEIIEAYRAQGNGSSDEYPNTDWQKESLTGSGFQQSHFLTINAGTEKVKMLTAFGLFDQKGLTENSGFRRYTIRNNADITFSEKLSAKIDLQYVNPIVTSPSASIEEIFQWMNSVPANQSFRNSDGSWGLGWNGSNPVSASIAGGVATSRSPFGSINAALIYRPVDWVTAEVNYAPKYSTNVNKNFREVVQSYYPDGTPAFAVPQRSALRHNNAQQMYNNMRATVTLDQQVSAHDFRLLLGASREDFRNDYIDGFRDIFVLPEFPVLDAGSALNQSATGSASEWALQSFFSRFNYNYQEKYLLELNARYDGSSRFLEGNRYGFFPSASAGWRFSEEAFMAGTKSWLSEGKIRASWGQLGNQNIGDYPAVSALDLGSYTRAGQIINTAALNNLSNPDITWEKTTERNIGVDLTFFNRLNLTADYYHRETSDILLLLDIPLIIGLNRPYQNAGVVENKGWEVALSYRNDLQRELRYNLTLNLSDVRNKVLDMRGINQTGLLVHREGHPTSSIFGYVVEGYFQSQEEIENHATQFGTLAPGDLKYRDQNGDNLINESDKVIVGSTIPRLTYSLNGHAAYKGFDLSLLLQGVGKADGYLYGAGIQPFTTTGAIGGTVREDNKDRWTPDNPNAAYPRLAFGQNNNSQASDFWMKNAAYLRLKNVQLGYSIPASWLSQRSVERFRIFANGSNLFSADDFWEGYDVEAPVGYGNYYPQVKVYTFGLEITF